MAFFKRVQKKVNDLWYPQSVTWGKAVTTREVADELSFISTVTRGDTYAVMENLGRVLSNFMGQGRTVKINGVGTFYYTATSTKRGVSTAAEVSASLINGVRVRFLPEVGAEEVEEILAEIVEGEVGQRDRVFEVFEVEDLLAHALQLAVA
jgi:predicted histone-like DNA-binding protein